MIKMKSVLIKIGKSFCTPKCAFNVKKSSPPALSKEEVIVKLVESLNIGGKEFDYKRVDIAFRQYEQIQKKLND